MKKQNGGKLILIIVMIAIITTALFGGYKFLRMTNRKAAHRIDDIVKETFHIGDSDDAGSDGSYVYKDQSSRTYDGKKLYQSWGYIYNDNGEIISDFHEGSEYGIQFAYDIDRKRGVFVYRNSSYVINADLEIEKKIDGCTCVGICYEGDYIVYSNSGSLNIYNVETGEEKLITSRGFDPVLSPDGKTVIFTGFKSGMQQCLYIGGLDREITEIVTVAEDGIIKPAAVSNDGETIYYNVLFSEDEGSYCYHDGTITGISNKYPRSCYFDRQCKTMLATDEKEAFYYDTSLKKKKVLLDEGFLRDVLIYRTDYCKTDSMEEGSIVVDTDCFSDVAMITTGMETYCFQGEIPKIVLLSDSGVFPRQGMTDEGPVSIYKENNKLFKSVNSGGVAYPTVIIPDAKDMISLEMKKDMSGGFFVCDKRDESGEHSYSLYSFNMDEAPLCIVENGNIGFEQVRWDNLYKKCYYISDGNLYSINDDGTGQNLIGEGFKEFTYFYGGDEAPTVVGLDLSEYMIIGEKTYKK